MNDATNMRALGIAKTVRAARYLDQIISHFGHRVQTERDGNRGAVHFDGATLRTTAGPEALALEITASDDASLARIKEVVKSHLERWGVRDGIAVEWEPTPPGAV